MHITSRRTCSYNGLYFIPF